MSFFTDHRSHYVVGFLYGLTLRSRSEVDRRTAIFQLDMWAWGREWAQNLKSNHPNEQLSEHQQREGRAWGLGARKACGITDLPFPSPPYELGASYG